MAYPTLKNINQNIDELANSKEPDEAGMVTVCMRNMKRLLKNHAVLYLGNGNCTFVFVSGASINCDIRFIKPLFPTDNAKTLLREIEQLLYNPERSSEETHAVFDFLKDAKVKKEFFK